MNSITFSLLRSNLCEIYRALHTTQAKPGALPLIAAEQTLTYRASWKGRWMQFWSVKPRALQPPICQIFLKYHSVNVGQRIYDQIAKWTSPLCRRITNSPLTRLISKGFLYFRSIEERIASYRLQIPFGLPRPGIMPLKIWQFEPEIDSTMSYTLSTLFNDCVLQNAYKAHHLRIAHWVKAINQKKQIPQQELIARYQQYLNNYFGKEEHSLAEEYATAFSQFMQQNGLLEDSKVIAIRQMVGTCGEATEVFWRFFLKSRQTPLTTPLDPFLKGQPSVLENKILYRACKQAQNIVELEGILEQDLPIAALSKINEEMEEGERLELEKWISKLNACKSKVPLKRLLSVLKEAVNIIQLAGVQSFQLDQLLMKLDEKGCEILQQDEIKHLKWRQRLCPRSVVTCNGKSFKLGVELGSKTANNRYRIFTLQEHPDWVVKIARNPLQLKMEAEKAKSEKWHWGVRLVSTIERIDPDSKMAISGLDQEGRCEIIERLEEPLSAVQWTSASPFLEQEDEEKALVIANHIYVMQDQMATPEGLSLQHLMFNSTGGLKAIRPLKKGAFNYNELETFSLSVGKGNPYIADFIMHVSQLARHPVACFYQGGVAFALRHGSTNNLSRAQDRQFKRDIYETRLEELCKQAIKLRTDCVTFVKDHLLGESGYDLEEEDLEQEVYNQLAQVYESSSSPGTLHREAMMQQVLQKMRNKKNSAQPGYSAASYYEGLFQKIKQNNLKALKT